MEEFTKLIAFYLPQFHPIPENDLWWGEGFTEWTNVRKAKPNFEGHYQPRQPGELGYYDLREIDVQKKQVALAREYGIHGFCFYYYWFDGKRLLERPLDQFIENKQLDFPFCICWANENWTRRWDGLDNEILISQHHTTESYLRFIQDVVPILKDERYIRIDGKPLFIIYRASHLPSVNEAVDIWREECRRQGVGEIFLAAVQSINVWDPRPLGFDAALEFPPFHCPPIYTNTAALKLTNPDFKGRVQDYRMTAELKMQEPVPDFLKFRTVIPSWDNTARRQNDGIVFDNSSPQVYKKWLGRAIQYTQENLPASHQFVFINAWNEWAEGAYLEPDLRHGRAYLQATHEALVANTQQTITQSPDEEQADLNFLLKTLYERVNEIEIERSGQLAQKDADIAMQTVLLKQREYLIAYQERQLAEQDNQMAEQESKISELFAQLVDRNALLREIEISKAWKLVMGLRKLRVWIVPPGSLRMKFLKYAWTILLFPLQIRKHLRLFRGERLIRSSDLFDAQWYLANNPDVSRSEMNPLKHYLLHGGFEGRDPSLYFSSRSYLESNMDVKQSGVNPLVHYLLYGRVEGRETFFVKDMSSGNAQVNRMQSPPFFFHIAWQQLRKLISIGRTGFTYLRNYRFRDISQAISKKIAERPKPIKITYSDRLVVQSLLKRLEISCSTDELISTLLAKHGRSRTGQVIANLREVEEFIVLGYEKKEQPLIQASELPVTRQSSKRRNILFITSEFPNPHHGGGNRVLNFIRRLSEGNDIYLCTSYYKPQHEALLPLVEPMCKSILRIPHINFNGKQSEIRSWLGGLHMDVVHYEWPHSLGNYALDFGSLQIFTYMEAVSLRLLMDMQRMPPLSEDWLNIFEQLSSALQLEIVQTAQTSVRVAVTTKDGEFFRKLCPHQEYVVLNHGLDFDSFELPDIEPEPNTLVFVGNYLHYPNMDAMNYFFKEIWGPIRSEIPDARIYVVGANPPPQLQAMADGKNVFVTGSVPDVRPYIQKASVCIAPLITGAGLRGKVIEYAALQRPFVATSIATEDLMLEDGIEYYCADNSIEFSIKVVKLLKDPQFAREMALQAYEKTKFYYDTQRLTGYLLSLYEQREPMN